MSEHDEVNLDHASIIDNNCSVQLYDVGAPDCLLAESVNANGARLLWLVDNTRIDESGVDLGNRLPPHELHGPLPADVAHRVASVPIRCGRPRADGRPCRSPVARPGDACAWHREGTPA